MPFDFLCRSLFERFHLFDHTGNPCKCRHLVIRVPFDLFEHLPDALPGLGFGQIFQCELFVEFLVIEVDARHQLPRILVHERLQHHVRTV